MATQLTASFTLEELCRSETATRRGLDNTPDAQAVENLRYLCEQVLQPVRDHFGEPIVVTSGYRGSALNKAVGGSSRSFHCHGCAADLRFTRASTRRLSALFAYIHDELPYTELIAEELPSGWIHVAIAKGREQEKQLKYKLVAGSVIRASYTEVMEQIGTA